MSNIVVPELGESVVEARVARWLKKAGDRVEVGEPVVELETEKIDLEVSAEKGGVLASIARQEGEDVKIGEILAVVDESGTAPVSEPAPTSNPIAPADSAIAPTAKPGAFIPRASTSPWPTALRDLSAITSRLPRGERWVPKTWVTL
jgi:2-oxoglutarate dehydrogenase E2 component (dihydrolipoamide succinyltransferase)